mgnify:CR=1 FL=1
MQQPDWLDSEAIDAARGELAEKRLEFARNYLVFDTDSRAKALLDHWEQHVLRKRTPVGASLQQYAADEAVRAFVGGILEQLRIAREGKL